MRFIDKVFTSGDAPWKSWILGNASPFDSSGSSNDSFLWEIINAELSTYRSLTYVNVHNGASTAFWYDHWLFDGPPYLSHAALFSHTTWPNVSVQKVFQTGFDLCLCPRLTNAASSQLASLLLCLQAISLDDVLDQRLMKLTNKCYSSRDAYAAFDGGQAPNDVHSQRIWSSRVPNKVKIFSWLYFKDRLSTSENLYAKHVLDNASCERCPGGIEDRHHVFFCYSTSAGVWSKLNLEHIVRSRT
jgi:hypothetical protein